MFHSLDSYLMEEYVWKMKGDPHSSQSPRQLCPPLVLLNGGIVGNPETPESMGSVHGSYCWNGRTEGGGRD